MSAFLLPKVVVKVAHLTAVAFLLSGVVGGKVISLECQIVDKQASFGGHGKLFGTIVFDEIHNERRWRLLGEGRGRFPE